MNEWTNEWTNKWTNEQTNEWRNQWMKEWINKLTTEKINEQTNEWMNKWMNEWMIFALMQLDAIIIRYTYMYIREYKYIKFDLLQLAYIISIFTGLDFFPLNFR